MSSSSEESNHDDCQCGDCEQCGNCGDCDACCPPDEDDEEVGGSLDQEVYDAMTDEVKNAGFSYVGAGMFRTVYIRDKVVIKVPHNQDGFIDNRTEAAAWRKFRNNPTPFGVHLAPCRLLPNGCLMMMAVDTDYGEFSDLPGWARSVDCSQVGFYKERLVAYDYALDVLEREEWEKEWGTASKFFHQNRLSYLRKKSAA